MTMHQQTALIIRAALWGADDTGTRAAITDLARQLADMFKADDAAFRYDRFLAACGLDNWGEPTRNPVAYTAIGDAQP